VHRINKSEITKGTLTKEKKGELHFRKPKKEDGAAIWQLIKQTGNMDLNSSYSYLMWCQLFSGTSIVAVRQKEEETIVGFISGYLEQDKPDTLFIWQVAVDQSERGEGIATKMVFQLLDRALCEDVQYIEATVSPSNTASQHLFKGLAKKLNTECIIGEFFSAEDFPESGHEDELLFTIGSINKNK